MYWHGKVFLQLLSSTPLWLYLNISDFSKPCYNSSCCGISISDVVKSDSTFLCKLGFHLCLGHQKSRSCTFPWDSSLSNFFFFFPPPASSTSLIFVPKICLLRCWICNYFLCFWFFFFLQFLSLSTSILFLASSADQTCNSATSNVIYPYSFTVKRRKKENIFTVQSLLKLVLVSVLEVLSFRNVSKRKGSAAGWWGSLEKTICLKCMVKTKPTK